jgi:hypothetical protein
VIEKKIEFVPSGRGKAQCPPDAAYPHGKAIPPLPGIADTCLVELPYPAPECGVWKVECLKCGCTAMVTAAGRPDDPISFYMPCIIQRRTPNGKELQEPLSPATE